MNVQPGECAHHNPTQRHTRLKAFKIQGGNVLDYTRYKASYVLPLYMRTAAGTLETPDVHTLHSRLTQTQKNTDPGVAHLTSAFEVPVPIGL